MSMNYSSRHVAQNSQLGSGLGFSRKTKLYCFVTLSKQLKHFIRSEMLHADSAVRSRHLAIVDVLSARMDKPK